MTAAVAELPRVNGRHRNRALAAARRVRAVELRTAGHTYHQIATELGYANRGTVYRVVANALETHTVEAVENLRYLEVARLDALQLAVWHKAMDGDVPSAAVAIRIIMERWRLLGLEGSGAPTVDSSIPKTLVVPQVT